MKIKHSSVSASLVQLTTKHKNAGMQEDISFQAKPSVRTLSLHKLRFLA